MRGEVHTVMRVLRRPSFVFGVTLWLAAALLWVRGSQQPSRALAQAVAVPAAASNAYWAGYVATARGPYSAVRATWTVPAVPCSPRSPKDSTVYVWIGEGGYVRGLASPLIQAGTASDCLGGIPRYHAFYEWYPGIYATDYPLTVHPNDTVTATIEQTEVNYWTLTMRDETTGMRSTTATFYAADVGSADFVVERPTVCSGLNCGQVGLARFDRVTFLHAQTWSAPAYAFRDVGQAAPIALRDAGSSQLLAQPGRMIAPTPGLSVLWRRST